MDFKKSMLAKIAIKLASTQGAVERYEALKNSTDYIYKTQKLKDRLTDEYKLWILKPQYKERLRNVEIDISIVNNMKLKTHNDQFNAKDRGEVDRLFNKYNLK